MQHQLLSPQELASVTQALKDHAEQRGNQILGSQLGALINHAIHPRTVRSLGGLKVLVDNDLSSLVVYTPLAGPNSDAHQIQIIPVLKTALSEPSVVTGAELWRIFSNPNLPVALYCTPAGEITVGPKSASDEKGVALLVRPTGEDYRGLAKQFAESYSEPEIQGQLFSVLEKQHFYNDWVSLLRQLRNSQINIFTDWGALRAEFVANKLREGLIKCGVDSARAAEIVVNCRPQLLVKRTPDVSVAKSPSSVAPTLHADAKQDLRSIIHQAVDLMSMAELRELRIPAGILHDLLIQRVQA